MSTDTDLDAYAAFKEEGTWASSFSLATRQLSAQLRAAEDRLRELEGHARTCQERADRAEKWLHRVSLEIEQQFFGRTEDRLSQPPPPAALLLSQRR